MYMEASNSANNEKNPGKPTEENLYKDLEVFCYLIVFGNRVEKNVSVSLCISRR